MKMKSVVRTCFVLALVFGRSSIAAPTTSYLESDCVLCPQKTQESKKSFQRSLSGLYSIESWKELDIAQPYRDFTQLYQAATVAQLELETLINEVALVTNTQSIIPAVKSEQRAKQKIDTELKGEAHKITDLARSSLVAKDIPGLVQAFELLNNEVTVIAVKNRFKSPTASGYRDLNILVRLPKSQMIAEVQLHLDTISTIKNGAEHEIYEQIQTIERTGQQNDRALSEFEVAQIARLRTQSLNLYQNAWQQYLQPEAMAS